MRKFLVLTAALPFFLLAQDRSDEDANWRIRREATEHSHVMRTLHMLTDRYGPRLTGSPQHEAAAKWAAATLTEWGLKNVRLEPWKWGHPGWSNELASGFLITPVQDTLTFEVWAWTPSTNGVVKGRALELIPPQDPTKEALTSWLD